MPTIQLRTLIPGPRSQALMKRRDAAVVRAAYHATPVFVAKAEGAVIEDVDGNRLIDFAGGIGCLNTGPVSYTHLDVYKRQLLVGRAVDDFRAAHRGRHRPALGGICGRRSVAGRRAARAAGSFGNTLSQIGSSGHLKPIARWPDHPILYVR